MPGRTDNEIKNYWHSYLKKRIAKAEESEAQTRTDQYTTTSSSENTEYSTLSSQNLTVTDQMPSFESFHHNEKLSINTDSQHFEFPKVPQRSPVLLPKLFFAEWLSLDQEVANSVIKPVASSDGFSHGSSSSFQDPFMNMYLDGAFGSDLHDGLSNASVTEIFSPEFKFETQVSGNEFVGPMSGNNICSDFHMNNDVMYIL